MDSALRPREIQARIRSGESLADVAQAAGVPAEKIEPYAAPVIAERAHMAGVALGASVRRRGEAAAHRNLRSTIDERLTQRGVDSDTVSWDAWRMEDRRWVIQAVYETGSTTHQAQFHFDQAGRFSVAANDEARSLIGERTPGQAPRPGAPAGLHDDELDELALVRAVTDQPQQTPQAEATPDNVTSLHAVPSPHLEPDDSPAETASPELAAPESTDAETRAPEPVTEPLASVDEPPAGDVPDTAEWPQSSKSPQEIGEQVEAEIDAYDVIPDGRSELDALYDMLGGIAEDSINIYAGLDDPPGRDRHQSEPDPAFEPPAQTESRMQPPKDLASVGEVPGSVATPPGTSAPDDASNEEPAAIDSTEGVPIELPSAASAREELPAAERPELPTAESPRAELPAAESSPIALPPAEESPAAPPAERPVTEPEQPSLVEQEQRSASESGPASTKPKPRKARKRASVPSWDEIMFGGPPTTRKKDD